VSVLERMRNGLVVACQAPESSPMASPEVMAAVARAAEMGGAAGIRADQPEVIAAVRSVVNVPIIGTVKRRVPGTDIYITPTFECARAAAAAGAELIALDATSRPRPDGVLASELIAAIRQSLNALVVADVASLEDGMNAEQWGANALATTLVPAGNRPDYSLLARLARAVEIPVFCEGHVRTPMQAAEALQAGAYAVVVGTAITSPEWLAHQFGLQIERLTAPQEKA
jgi:N-acylglucosamine-6-phosphate 2-epimerase